MEIETILLRYPHALREHLIPILQDVQESQGYLSKDAILAIGRHLNLPPSKIYGVATFYNQFRFQPKGKYHITVCRGTACHVKGSINILESLKNVLKLKPGETSRDGLFSLEVVACIGACGLAPVICINDEFHACMSPDAIENLIDAYRQKEAANDTAIA